MAAIRRFERFDLAPVGHSDRLPEGAGQRPPSTQELLGALRRFLYELRSDEEPERDFVALLKKSVLRRFDEEMHVRVRLSVGRTWPRQLPVSVSSNLYRVLEEALNNARLHGHADDISIRLQLTPGGRLEMTLTDNGNSQNQLGESRFRGVGTLGLRDKVNSLGGDLRVESAPRGQTRVRISFPASRQH